MYSPITRIVLMFMGETWMSFPLSTLSCSRRVTCARRENSDLIHILEQASHDFFLVLSTRWTRSRRMRGTLAD